MGNHHKNKRARDVLKDPWRASAIVLGVVVLALLIVVAFSGAGRAGVISKDKAGRRLVGFLSKQAQGTVEYVSAKDIGNLYEVTVLYQNQKIPLYVTKDGKYLVQKPIPLSSGNEDSDKKQSSQRSSTSANIPKSNKPFVELFVMAYCPYGTQMEKGIIPVVRKLGDKIGFKVKFVNYAMHPSKGEVEEELNQYCIQEEQSDKYLDYLSCFLEDGDGARCLKEIGIDASKLKTCTDRVDKEFDVIKNLKDRSSWAGGRFPKVMIYDKDNQKYDVRGSPTLVVNGQKVQSGRSAQEILNTICSSFTTKPKECDSDMTSFGTPAPGFGFGTQGGSASSAGCGA